MKNFRREDFEIMAPVGSYESLSAALNAGADSVYFGVEGLNMRSRSSANFNLDDLKQITSLCKEKGVKCYLTLNTVIYDEDLKHVSEILDACHEAGISAVIASDYAVMEMARERNINVHVSTQCNVTNIKAVEHYADYADVMVLARELTLPQVKAIHDEIVKRDLRGPGGNPVRIEMFCHGALCLAVSGKCYLSLHLMEQSANRGACTQICRRSYNIVDRETGDELEVEDRYVMSPKDLKTISFLDKMVEAGVRVFKIEGRARGPEYVSNVVTAYRLTLDAVLEGTFSDEKLAQWEEPLSKVFNRGYWDGYYQGAKIGEWSEKYGSSATRTKFYCAKALRYYPRLGVGEFLLESGELRPGQELLIIGPSTGVIECKAEELRLDRDAEPLIVKGQVFSMPVPSKIRPGDKMYRWDTNER